MAVTLYAWTCPAFVSGSPVDHTWVTTYDNRVSAYPNVAAVAAARQDYWFCWGSFHASGGVPKYPDGLVTSAAGDLALARCLVQSNADSSAVFAARGTIFTYGVDGVCHQLANQVLYATGIGGAPPLTVAGVGGYLVSSAIYGTYGLQHAAWRAKIAACASSVAVAPTPAGRSGRIRKPKMPPFSPQPHDEFEEHVVKTLGADRIADAARLLSLRAQFQAAAAAHAHAMTTPTASELNDRNQRFLHDAAKLLSAAEYEAVFGVKPGERVNLVVEESKR